MSDHLKGALIAVIFMILSVLAMAGGLYQWQKNYEGRMQACVDQGFEERYCYAFVVR